MVLYYEYSRTSFSDLQERSCVIHQLPLYKRQSKKFHFVLENNTITIILKGNLSKRDKLTRFFTVEYNILSSEAKVSIISQCPVLVVYSTSKYDKNSKV